MIVFLSYRRDHGRPSAQVRAWYEALRQAAEPDDRVLLDVRHVDDVGTQAEFATALVDNGLNRSDALVAVIDAAWTAPAILDRLARADTSGQSSDWVAFELHYALEYGLAMALCGGRETLDRLGSAPLPSPWGPPLQHQPQFSGATPSPAQAARLLAHLRAEACKRPRRASNLKADHWHNDPEFTQANQTVGHDQPRAWATTTTVAAGVRQVLVGAAAICALLAVLAWLDGSKASAGSLLLAGVACIAGAAAAQRASDAWVRRAYLGTRQARHRDSR